MLTENEWINALLTIWKPVDKDKDRSLSCAQDFIGCFQQDHGRLPTSVEEVEQWLATFDANSTDDFNF
jgi:hypothetical protein